MANLSSDVLQQNPLLATKLYIPPTRPELVPRPRLIERLNAGIRSGHKLTLISAPAGFGKTTLLSEWVQAMGEATPPIAVAWLRFAPVARCRKMPGLDGKHSKLMQDASPRRGE